MEIGESALEGATRETLEEACAEVEGLSPFAQIDITHIGQVREILLMQPILYYGNELMVYSFVSLRFTSFSEQN